MTDAGETAYVIFDRMDHLLDQGDWGEVVSVFESLNLPDITTTAALRSWLVVASWAIKGRTPVADAAVLFQQKVLAEVGRRDPAKAARWAAQFHVKSP